MKKLHYILFLALFTLFSCESYFGDEPNRDPDNPTAVTPNVILPQVQARLAYTYGGDFTRYLSLFTRHIDGVSRQFAVLGEYGITGSDVDAPWANMYTGTMNSNRELYEQSIAAGHNHYAGISAALEAYSIMLITDCWGDVPYSDAFKFGENGVYQPEFDAQEAIYNSIFAKLDEARTLFSMDNGGNAPSTGDIMYGGDISLWVKFCNVLEARAHLHLVERNGSARADALAALNKGSFASMSEEASFPFGEAATENSPWFQYIEQRDDCEVGSFYLSMLESLNDPRITTYGAPQAVPGHPIYTRDQPVKLLSFTEQEFMRAEVLLGSDAAGAYEAYLAGIRSSFEEAKLTQADYDTYTEQSSVSVGASNLDLEHVMTQKYLALFTSPEVYNDWRRTGLPTIPPVTGSAIPRRLPYPNTEVFSNENTPSPANVGIFTKVWWDAD